MGEKKRLAAGWVGGCAGASLRSHGEGMRAVRGNKNTSLVVLKMSILPPTPHSPVD